MPMVEIHLPQPLFVLSNQCITHRSRLRALLHPTRTTSVFFVSVWQTAILLSVGLSEKRKWKCARGKKSNFQHTDSVQGIRQTTLAT
jgi:hypothetical protein